MKYPLVYIIILNWNGLKDTLECLESVYRLNYPNFDVIVVDNNSMDNSVKVIRQLYPRVITIENKRNLGYTGGNNVAMHYALKNGAQYVWLLNNDTVVDRDSLLKLVSSAEALPNIGLVSPVIYDYGSPGKVQFYGGYIDWRKYRLVSFKSSQDFESYKSDFSDQFTFWLWGTALLIKRNVIDVIGSLKEDYFAYWEDTEYSARAFENGFRSIIEPSAKVYHKVALTELGKMRSAHYFYFMIRNQYMFWMTYLKGIRKLFFFIYHIGETIGAVASCRNHHSEKNYNACLDGMWSAWIGVKGPWKKEKKLPGVFRIIINGFLLWHPFFWSNLLRGELGFIIRDSIKRAKLKVMKV